MHGIETVKKLNAAADHDRKVKVEKVAQAIFATSHDFAEWHETGSHLKAMYYGYARAAIAAYEGED